MIPTENFETASKAVLKFLHQRLGFDLWMITRMIGDDWIILQTEDQSYGVQEKTVLNWADSFCSQMILGNGPNIAANSKTIPAYANAPIGKTLQIGAYIGLPLMNGQDDLFGTLCAIHPASMPESIQDELPMVELLSQLLSSILTLELKAEEHVRELQRIKSDALTDSLSGLYNRRGWDGIVSAEENRCTRYGHSACIIMIDLDGLKVINDSRGHAAGDELIRLTGQTLLSVLREHDIAARLGGDEFAILAVECSHMQSKVLIERVESALQQASIKASVGVGIRSPGSNMAAALDAADKNMYINKNKKQKSDEPDSHAVIPIRSPFANRRSFE